jgi:hypothetical protein
MSACGLQPDSTEKCLCYCSGFIFGGIISFLVAIREIQEITGMFWAIVIGAALQFGFSAMRYGDSF